MENSKVTVQEAIKVLMAAGAVFTAPSGKHLGLKAAANRLDCSAKYLREHLDEFPNAWRMTGGEIRVPERDIESFAVRGKIKR